MSTTHKFFCRTYARDADRLRYLLRSIEKFANGFDGIVVACPEASLGAIFKTALDFHNVEVLPCNTSDYDFIAQQITKLTAYRYCDADVIVHIDSDCIFTKPFSPADLYHDDRILLLNCPYSYFYSEGVNCPWQSVTSQFAKRQVDREFMRQFPLCYPRELYQDLEAWFVQNHGYPIDAIASHVNGDHFSEFNLLGAFSFYSSINYHSHIDSLQQQMPSFVQQMCLYDSRNDRSIPQSELAYLEEFLG